MWTNWTKIKPAVRATKDAKLRFVYALTIEKRLRQFRRPYCGSIRIDDKPELASLVAEPDSVKRMERPGATNPSGSFRARAKSCVLGMPNLTCPPRVACQCLIQAATQNIKRSQWHCRDHRRQPSLGGDCQAQRHDECIQKIQVHKKQNPPKMSTGSSAG